MQSTSKYTEKLSRAANRYFHDFQETLFAEAVQKFFAEAERRFQQAQDFSSWRAALDYWNELNAHLQTHFSLIELAFQCDTEDKAVEAEERRLKQEVLPIIEAENAKIRIGILASAHISALKDELGPQYLILLQLKQDSFNPSNIPVETRLSEVMLDYTKLSGSASFELDGVSYPISHYKKFSASPDAELRRRSFVSYSGWYLQHSGELEQIYDRAALLRAEMAHTLGYENFTRLGYQKMGRTDYGPEEVGQLRDQIFEVMVPLANRIRQEQAKSLGESKLSVYNQDYFPKWQLGNLKVSVEEQVPTALKVYEKLSPRLAAHFQKMISAGLIDVPARPGKAPGAFCTDFPDYRVPFIFLNSVDEAYDVTTLLHESGHAFQAWESRGIDMLELRWPGLEACEVHSMSMEFLAYPYYDEFFSSEDAEKYRQRHLADSILLLPYIAMVDEFQHLVYSGQAEGSQGRAKAWEQMEQKYMPGLDFSAAPDWRRGRWLRQLHIFRAPFYYIDYAIAQIGAWQLWVQSREDHEKAMQSYLKLCQLGGTLALKDFFQAGGLQLPFSPGMLKGLMEKVLALQAV